MSGQMLGQMTGQARRKYSDSQKAELLALMDANGGNAEQTARETGVPSATIKRWRSGEAVVEEVALLRSEKREGLRRELLNLAWKALRQTDKMLEHASAKEAAAIAGIAIDKMTVLDTVDAKENGLVHEQVGPFMQELIPLMKRYIPQDDRAQFREEMEQVMERHRVAVAARVENPRTPDEYGEFHDDSEFEAFAE
jgi:transposase-like protein